jgi:hypothetical protein
MAFTSVTSTPGKQQFQQIFSKTFTALGVANLASIAAGGELATTITVPGVALGDMIISWGASDDTTPKTIWNVSVTAADTITFTANNPNASNAIDLGSMTFKFVAGRPSF